MYVRSATVYYGQGYRETLFVEGESERDALDKLSHRITDHRHRLGAALSYLYLLAYMLSGGFCLLLTQSFDMGTGTSFVFFAVMFTLIVRSPAVHPTFQRTVAWHAEMKSQRARPDPLIESAQVQTQYL